ncbi:GMC oxidoreductase [Rhodoplanes sp. TEM]|nr:MULTISPECIES: GMC oxidoreductase [Rhodoplanes]
MIATETASSSIPFADVCVVGAGPVGLAVSLECEARGLRVVLLESGLQRNCSEAQALAALDIVDERRHAPAARTVWRGLGGTSERWGGRCVPLEDIDFSPRPAIRDTGWPIGYAEFGRHFERAARFLDCGKAEFRSRLDLPGSPHEILVSNVERWSRQRRLRIVHGRCLKRSERLRVYLGCTVVRIVRAENGDAEALVVRSGDHEHHVRAGRFVLAAGGVETTRLLLNTRIHAGERFGGPALGRYYMGHLAGSIARVEITDRSFADSVQFRRDPDGVFVRRRLTVAAGLQDSLGLRNISMWLDNRPLGDPWHRSGMLSAIHLLRGGVDDLSAGPAPAMVRRLSASRRIDHAANVASHLPDAATGLARLAASVLPGITRGPHFFHRTPDDRYSLRFSSEQTPLAESTVTLSEARDRYGVRRAKVDLRFAPRDFASVVEAHRIVARWFGRTRLGRFEFVSPEDELEQSVSDQAWDGFHQIGTTRMSRDARSGVVDEQCRVHGTSNLYVAGPSVFPTSGHANPTFSAVVLAVRLAEHLAWAAAKPIADAITPARAG